MALIFNKNVRILLLLFLLDWQYPARNGIWTSKIAWLPHEAPHQDCVVIFSQVSQYKMKANTIIKKLTVLITGPLRGSEKTFK